MPARFGRLHQRLSDPILTLLTVLLSVFLFVIGPMQATGIVNGNHLGYFFAVVLVPAAFLYSRNLFVVGPISLAIALMCARFARPEALPSNSVPLLLRPLPDRVESSQNAGRQYFAVSMCLSVQTGLEVGIRP
jgi:hypothetical protein